MGVLNDGAEAWCVRFWPRERVAKARNGPDTWLGRGWRRFSRAGQGGSPQVRPCVLLCTLVYSCHSCVLLCTLITRVSSCLPTGQPFSHPRIERSAHASWTRQKRIIPGPRWRLLGCSFGAPLGSRGCAGGAQRARRATVNPHGALRAVGARLVRGNGARRLPPAAPPTGGELGAPVGTAW